MIFLRHRRAKQRQEAITTKINETPSITVQDLLDHSGHRLHAPMHGLGTQAHCQRQGISQAAAEHRHLFVFPSERKRMATLFSEVRALF